jgi:hypothetical protein
MKKLLLNSPYRKKNQFLLIGSILLFIILWFSVFKNTYNLYSECSLFEKQLKIAEQAPQKNKELLKLSDELDTKLKNQQQADTNLQQAILTVVAPFLRENNLVLREFPRPFISLQKGYIIETNTLEIQGAFIPLLKLVYLLEKRSKIGKLVSLKFHAGNDSKIKSYVLMATIYIENIKKK